MADGGCGTPASTTQQLGGIYRTADSSVTYAVHIAPPDEGDYSLSGFFGSDAPTENPALARRWGDFLAPLGVRRAFAPNTGFTRHVGNPEHFKDWIDLPGSAPLFRNHMERGRRIKTDAVVLEQPGDALALAVGGCSAIVMVCGDRIVAGHGGLDSLVSRRYVLNESPRDEGSIVDTMTAVVSGHQSRPLARASCRAFASLPLRSYEFPDQHPVHRRYNAELFEFLKARYRATECGILVREVGKYYLDQGKLIEAQAKQYGFHSLSTCLFPLKNQRYAHTRHRIQDLRSKRNALAIVRLT